MGTILEQPMRRSDFLKFGLAAAGAFFLYPRFPWERTPLAEAAEDPGAHVDGREETVKVYSVEKREFVDTRDKGINRCVCCGNDLFLSDTKYDSGTGWPSFHAPVAEENIRREPESGPLVVRPEVLCRLSNFSGSPFH